MTPGHNINVQYLFGSLNNDASTCEHVRVAALKDASHTVTDQTSKPEIGEKDVRKSSSFNQSDVAMTEILLSY